MKAGYQIDPEHSGFTFYPDQDSFRASLTEHSDVPNPEDIDYVRVVSLVVATLPRSYPVWARLEGSSFYGTKKLFFSYLYPGRDLTR